MITIKEGDCRKVMSGLAESSIHACVTDPPYHLTTGKKGGSGSASLNLDSPAGRSRVTTGFMGMAWDGGDVAMRADTWAGVLRVLTPGAHLLAFGGTRTFHRMMCAIEDAGFEIRDTIMWVYGSGFPKSRNLDGEWDGWGTALKPAWEPIILARKPIEGTVAENVAKYGTGALNIDGCRVPAEGEALAGGAGGIPCRHREGEPSRKRRYTEKGATNFAAKPGPRGGDEKGRWPANVVHDGSAEVVDHFPAEAGASAPVRGTEPTANGFSGAVKFSGQIGRVPGAFHFDHGSAARFFYCAKADRHDRNEGCEGLPARDLNWSSGKQSPGTFQAENTDRSATNFHPTVKPTDLMRWLCRLVTPPPWHNSRSVVGQRFHAQGRRVGRLFRRWYRAGAGVCGNCKTPDRSGCAALPGGRRILMYPSNKPGEPLCDPQAVNKYVPLDDPRGD